jgi:ribosome-binding factor A
VSQRTDRIDELFRQEIGAILARDVGDPRIGFATITDVETTPDLSHARVWVSVIGTEPERKATVRALDHAMGYIRRELGTRLRLRRIPEFHVHLDETAKRGTRVLQLLSELEAGAAPDTAPAAAESLPTPVPRIRQEADADDLPTIPAAVTPPVKPWRRHRKGSGSAGPKPAGSGRQSTKRRQGGGQRPRGRRP